MIGRALMVGLALLTMAACAGPASRAGIHIPDSERVAPGRLIIVTVANDSGQIAQHAGSTPRSYEGLEPYSAGASARASIEAIAGQYHLTQVAAWPIEPLRVHCVVFRIPRDSSRERLLELMRNDSRLVLAQPMQDFDTLSQSYNDPYVSLQRGFARIDVANAQRWSTGEKVRVALIDTGVDTTHPDLAGRIIATRNFVDTDVRQFDRDRHGTEVAGVIAAVRNNRLGIVGIAPEVRLIVLKACWQLAPDVDSARCNSLTLAQAIVAAMELHAQVVNLSLAGPVDPLLAALVEQGNRRGMIFVGAALQQRSREPGFPAGVRDVIAVKTAEEGIDEVPAVSAPGREILTLIPGGRYDFVSGASLATAHVTGTIALLLAQHAKLSPAVIAGVLNRTSTRTRTSTPHGDELSINACTALAALDARVGCAPPALAGSAAQKHSPLATAAAPGQL